VVYGTTFTRNFRALKVAQKNVLTIKQSYCFWASSATWKEHCFTGAAAAAKAAGPEVRSLNSNMMWEGAGQPRQTI